MRTICPWDERVPISGHEKGSGITAGNAYDVDVVTRVQSSSLAMDG
ncbi:MAG TPA: hypothetical protein VEL31_22040 [Ktedonobacteraceae bacterium]|nr:hypothetical protein [Ktedonobacteraceae bacterium]